MTPLRAQMIRDMQLQRLAPKTQKASVAAVAGLAKFSQCSPDRLRPEQIRTYLHHLLVERRLAWSSCNQAAAGLKFFSTKTLSWDALHLNLPPRTGRSQLPQVLSIEELQRLFTSAKNPRHRVLLMTTYAAGLRVSEVVRLKLTDIESDRMLVRVNQGKGRKDRYYAAVRPSADRTARLLVSLSARPVAVYGTRSPQAAAHRHGAEDLLSCEAARGDHPRPRYPYAAERFDIMLHLIDTH